MVVSVTASRFRLNSSLLACTVCPNEQVVGEEQILAEIVARGPVACSLCASVELERYQSGIFVDTTGCTAQTHSVVVSCSSIIASGNVAGNFLYLCDVCRGLCHVLPQCTRHSTRCILDMVTAWRHPT